MVTQTQYWGTEAWFKSSSMEDSICLLPHFFHIREGKMAV